jgi:hypothetical protein
MTTQIIVSSGQNYIIEVGLQGPPGSSAVQGAIQVPFTPYHTITATNAQAAIEQLADQLFKSATAPTGNVEEGDLWFDTSADKLKTYINGAWSIIETDLSNAQLNGGYF